MSRIHSSRGSYYVTSRNPKIAQYLKAYKYVKEFGEGMDRIYRELNVNHTSEPKLHLDAFILKITVNKSTGKLIENTPDVIENNEKLTEKVSENLDRVSEKVSDVIENEEKLTENHQKLIEKLTENFMGNGDKLTENRKKILLLMINNPYISKEELSKCVGISVAAISANITAMRGKYLNRVGPDKGGFWEVILE